MVRGPITGSELAYRSDVAFSTNQMPWHGVGVRLENPRTAEEAIREAKLDWEVESKPIFVRENSYPYNLVFREVPGKQAIQRVDTKEVFGVFSKGYTPLQNRDAFVNLIDAVVGEGQAIYHTAGSLAGGRRIFLLAQLPGGFEVPGTHDPLETYLLLSNSHDGSLAVGLQWVTLRPACFNTLTYAPAAGFKSKHQGDILGRVTEARSILGLSERHFEWMKNQVGALAKYQIKEQELDMLLWDIYELDPELELTDQHHLKKLNFEQTKELFETGQGNNQIGVRGTAWAALNAVTEYVDHRRPVGNSHKSVGNPEFQSRRLNNSWFGPGVAIKHKAMEKLLAMAN